MNATRLLTTLFAAAAVTGGISAAVAQSVTPRTPAPAVEYDSGARPPAAPPAASAPMQAAPAPMAAPAASEPMPQPTRG